MLTALKRYPKRLSGGLTLRPMENYDEAALVDFFKRIPVEERRLFKDDVRNAEVIRGWVRNLNYENILPILVFDGARIVADASLHRDRKGWSRHVAKIRITLDPEFRRRGLAKALVREFIEIAPDLQVAILDAEILSRQKGAIQLFEDLGFIQTATLTQHAIDLSGRPHDVLLYAFTVTPPEKLAPEAALTEDEVDVGGGA